MKNNIFNHKDHWNDRAIGDLRQSYLKRRSRKVRDALNQPNPVYPELHPTGNQPYNQFVDLSPDENLVVPPREYDE
jgi:hypothetical protein